MAQIETKANGDIPGGVIKLKPEYPRENEILPFYPTALEEAASQ